MSCVWTWLLLPVGKAVLRKPQFSIQVSIDFSLMVGQKNFLFRFFRFLKFFLPPPSFRSKEARYQGDIRKYIVRFVPLGHITSYSQAPHIHLASLIWFVASATLISGKALMA